MLRIGEFSVLSSISIYMLRNYDKIGLLVPEYTDENSGYRYYSRQQLVTANRIVALKAMGFGLKEIESMLNMDQDLLNQSLLEKSNALKTEIVQLQSIQKRIEQALQEDSSDKEYALSVAVKQIPGHNVISYTGEIQHFWDEGVLWERITRECAKNGIVISEDANAEARWISVDSENEEKKIEVRFWTEQKYIDYGILHGYRVEESQIASVVFEGSYNQIPRINMYIAQWLEQNEYELSGDIYFRYHRSPKDSKREEDLLSEMCFPIQKKK